MTTTSRLDWAGFAALLPRTNDALLAVGATLEGDHRTRALASLRTSQRNGCAFCIAYHLDHARSLGIEQRRLDLVAAWRHSDAFTPAERIALALAEVLAGNLDDRPDEALYSAALAALGPEELARTLVAIGLTNLWNRLGVAYRFPVPA